jgi:hypothetical protein
LNAFHFFVLLLLVIASFSSFHFAFGIPCFYWRHCFEIFDVFSSVIWWSNCMDFASLTDFWYFSKLNSILLIHWINIAQIFDFQLSKSNCCYQTFAHLVLNLCFLFCCLQISKNQLLCSHCLIHFGFIFYFYQKTF